MPFYELVFETGRSSVINCADDNEALRAIGEQHRRAKAGEPSLASAPDSPPAERIVKAFKFDEHPNDYNPADTLTADELKAELPNLVDALADHNGVVSVGVLATEVRGLTHPMANNPGPHDSQFRMEPVGELTSAQVEAAANAAEAEISAVAAAESAGATPPSESAGA